MNTLKKHLGLLNSICFYTGALITSIIFIWGEDFPDPIIFYSCILSVLLFVIWGLTVKSSNSNKTRSRDFKFMISAYRHWLLSWFFSLVYIVAALTSATYALIYWRFYNIPDPLKYLLIFAWGVYIANNLIIQANKYLRKVAAQSQSKED